MIETAVILVAGMGTRLSPLTHTLPKCLVEVNGRPILINTLAHLADRGIKQVIMLVGYMDDIIQAEIGNQFGTMVIQYIKNPLFRNTNNMYSLWLAKDHWAADNGFLLIEGDLFFEVDVLARLLDDPAPSCWAADEFFRFKDGCMLTADSGGGIKKIEIIRRPLPVYEACQHKSAGMLKLDYETVPILWDYLDFEVRHWHLNLYYDQVLARHLMEFNLDICNINGLKWMEIDDLQDLKQAESLFGATPFKPLTRL